MEKKEMPDEEKEHNSPVDYLIKSLEYGIKALEQYQIDKKRRHELIRLHTTMAERENHPE